MEENHSSHLWQRTSYHSVTSTIHRSRRQLVITLQVLYFSPQCTSRIKRTVDNQTTCHLDKKTEVIQWASAHCLYYLFSEKVSVLICFPNCEAELCLATPPFSCCYFKLLDKEQPVWDIFFKLNYRNHSTAGYCFIFQWNQVYDTL